MIKIIIHDKEDWHCLKYILRDILIDYEDASWTAEFLTGSDSDSS